jgi:hypothetical protein
MIFMLLYITLTALAITVLLTIMAVKLDWNEYLAGTLGVGILTFTVTAAIMIAIMLSNNINVDAQISRYQERYDSLTYQLNNGIFEEGNPVAKKQLYDQIQEWNEDLASDKKSRHNVWVGIFYSPIYDQFDFIRLPEPEHN